MVRVIGAHKLSAGSAAFWTAAYAQDAYFLPSSDLGITSPMTYAVGEVAGGVVGRIGYIVG